jgi:hypothetical protein
MDQRFRSIVFTVNNYTEETFQQLLHHEKFKYVIISKEVGQNGTPHLQGYAELKTQNRFNAIKRNIHPTMHFERRYGSQKEAVEYCKKEGNYQESGQANRQGERTDLKKIRESVEAGISY